MAGPYKNPPSETTVELGTANQMHDILRFGRAC